MALAGRENVLRVLVTATASTRARRLAQGDPIGLDDATEAVGRSDRGRADYLRRFYGVEREQPTDYDVVLNTDQLTTEQAAALVVEAARLLGSASESGS